VAEGGHGGSVNGGMARRRTSGGHSASPRESTRCGPADADLCIVKRRKKILTNRVHS
jgi:hypothetical protein